MPSACFADFLLILAHFPDITGRISREILQPTSARLPPRQDFQWLNKFNRLKIIPRATRICENNFYYQPTAKLRRTCFQFVLGPVVRIRIVYWRSVPLKGTGSSWSKLFTGFMWVPLLNMRSETVRLRWRHGLKLCIFAEFAEWNLEALLNARNGVNIWTYFDSAYSEKMENKILCLCWRRSMKLFAFTVYAKQDGAYSPNTQKITITLNISSNTKPKQKNIFNQAPG